VAFNLLYGWVCVPLRSDYDRVKTEVRNARGTDLLPAPQRIFLSYSSHNLILYANSRECFSLRVALVDQLGVTVSASLVYLLPKVALGGLVVIVLAVRPKVRGFKAVRGRWRAIKIRSTTSFGGEVKPSVHVVRIYSLLIRIV
jgi:hypothetical protein